eukprot:TRINITY_DN4488_c0_g1_i1.p1 TRINITY_DN4488_c0_g1~~TRINITY_DN4488_c0_g1_i1.p1  ORF type:complete len:375 (-),score=84.75 TRINITY_DN4488_c0_g1_i1:990-2114(-)
MRAFFSGLANTVKHTVIAAKDEFMSETNVFTDDNPLDAIPARGSLFEGSAAYRANLLRLSKDEQTFLKAAPDDFFFLMSDHVADAKAAMAFDRNLSQIRFQLVPRFVKETQFWKNYFYNLLKLRAAEDPSGGSQIAFPTPTGPTRAATTATAAPSVPAPPPPKKVSTPTAAPQPPRTTSQSQQDLKAAAARGSHPVRPPTKQRSFGLGDDIAEEDVEFASDAYAAQHDDKVRAELHEQLGLESAGSKSLAQMANEIQAELDELNLPADAMDGLVVSDGDAMSDPEHLSDESHDGSAVSNTTDASFVSAPAISPPVDQQAQQTSPPPVTAQQPASPARIHAPDGAAAGLHKAMAKADSKAVKSKPQATLGDEDDI